MKFKMSFMTGCMLRQKKFSLNFFLKLFLITGIILISACAASPHLPDLPEEFIQRRATLPDGVSQWHMILGHAFDHEPNSTIYPLYWEQGVTSRLTLIWIPLPLEARYLIYSDDVQWIVADATLLGPVKAREKDFVWRPGMNSTWRRRLSDFLALEEKISYQAEIKRSAKNNFGRTIGLENGLLFQLHPKFSIKPSLTAMNEEGETKAWYLGSIPDSAHGDAALLNSRWRFPLGLNMSVTLSRQFELALEMQYLRLGYEPGFRSLPIFLSLIHSW